MGWGWWCAGDISSQRRLGMQHTAKKTTAREPLGGNHPRWLRWMGPSQDQALLVEKHRRAIPLPRLGACLGLVVRILSCNELAGRHPVSSKPGGPDIPGWGLAHPPPPQVPVPSIPQPCARFPAKISISPITPPSPCPPLPVATGPDRTWGQWDNKGKRSTNPQGHWGPRGCPRHPTTNTSGSAPAPCGGGCPLPLSWLLLLREVRLSWDACPGFYGDEAFWGSHCGCQMLLYHLPPSFLVAPIFVALLPRFTVLPGDENQTPAWKPPAL